MPIVYAPQAPVAGAYASALSLGRAQAAAAAAERARSQSSGSYSSAVDPSVIARMIESDADRTQGAIANRDRQDLQGRQIQAELDQRPGLINLQAHNEAALQDQRIQGQMAMQNNELSQQEKIRYMRMKNSLGAIEADPTLTYEDKQAYRTMLQTGINPYEQRLAKQRVDAQAEANKMLAEQRSTQAALNETDVKMSAKSFDERKVFHVDDSIVSKIMDDFRQNLPMGNMIPDATLKAMATQEAKNQGLGSYFYQESHNKLIPLDGGKGTSGSKGEGKGQGEQAFDGILTEERFNKMYSEALDQAMKESPSRRDADQFISPDTANWTSTRIRQIMNDRLEAMRTFLGNQPQHGKRYIPLSEKNKVATVASDNFKTDAQRRVDILSDDANKLVNRTDIEPEQKFRALEAMQNVKLLISKYPDPNKIPAEAAKKLREYQKVYNSIPRDESVTNPPTQKPATRTPLPGPGIDFTAPMG